MMYKEIEVSKLKEHPENTKYFTDIEVESVKHWDAFLTSVKKHGILEPLVVNRKSFEIISGNQRYKAAMALGIKTAPCVLVEPQDKEEEIKRLLISNVMRRLRVDPFVMMDYIAMERKGFDPHGHNEKLQNVNSVKSGLPGEEVQKMVGKSSAFITAADRFSAIPPDEQENIKQWYRDNQPTQKALTDEIAKVSKLYSDATDEVEKLKKDAKSKDDDITKLELEKKEMAEQIASDKLLVEAKILEARFDDLVKDAASVASSISIFLKMFNKLAGKDADMSGIETHIANGKLNTLGIQITKLQERFNVRLIEE